jgi:PAS domain S-box-containing protein
MVTVLVGDIMKQEFYNVMEETYVIKVLLLEQTDEDHRFFLDMFKNVPDVDLKSVRVENVETLERYVSVREYDMIFVGPSLLKKSRAGEPEDVVAAAARKVLVEAETEDRGGLGAVLMGGRTPEEEQQMLREVLFMIISDVRERGKLSGELKRSQRLLKSSEARFEKIIRKSADGVIIVNREGIVLFINPAAEELLGRTSEEIIENEFGFPTVAGEFTEIEILKKDMSIRTAEMRVVDIEFQDEPMFLIAIRDISRRVRNENYLRHERDVFSRFVETSPVGIIVYDKNGKISFTNRRITDNLGLPPDSITGRKYDDPDFKVSDCLGNPLPASEMGFALVKQTGKPIFGMCIILEKPDGEKLFLSVNIAPLTDEEGNFDGAVSTLEDLTTRRSYEADLAKLNKELDIRAKQLEESNKDLERFAFLASHDLNEPLNVIKGFSMLLKKRYSDKMSADAIEFIEFINEETIRLQSLIKGLLQISRISTRGKPFRRFDPKAEIESVLSGLQNLISENDAEIIVDDLPEICGDRVQVGQVFQNLISNAIRFRKKDVLPIIHIGGEEREDDYLFFCQDNGRGIRPEDRNRIFEMFQRSGQQNGLGTGIGLAITRKIVKRHGGDIWVESEPEKGSTFYFTIAKKTYLDEKSCKKQVD